MQPSTDFLQNQPQNSQKFIISSRNGYKRISKLIKNKKSQSGSKSTQANIHLGQDQDEGIIQGWENFGNSSTAYCYQHFVYNISTGFYSCKYCKVKFEQDRQNKLRRLLTRHLTYHHAMVELPRKKERLTISKSNKLILAPTADIDSGEYHQIRKSRNQKIRRGLRSKAYDYFKINFDQGSAICHFCKMDLTKIKSPAPLVEHLRKYHMDKFKPKSGKVTKRISSNKKTQNIEQAGIQQDKLFDLKVGSLKLKFGFGIRQFKLRWILKNQMGLSHKQTSYYIKKYNQNIKNNVIYLNPNLTPLQKLIQTLQIKNNKVLQFSQLDQIRNIPYRIIIIVQEKMLQNINIYGEHLNIDILHTQNNLDFRVTMLIWGYNDSNTKINLGVILFQSELHANFQSIFCQFLAEICKFPQSFEFYISQDLFCNGWDPRPVFQQINVHMNLVSSKFIPYKFQEVGQILDGKIIRVVVKRRKYYFSGLNKNILQSLSNADEQCISYDQQRMLYLNQILALMPAYPKSVTEKILIKLYSRQNSISVQNKRNTKNYLANLFSKLFFKQQGQVIQNGQNQLDVESSEQNSSQYYFSPEEQQSRKIVMNDEDFICRSHKQTQADKKLIRDIISGDEQMLKLGLLMNEKPYDLLVQQYRIAVADVTINRGNQIKKNRQKSYTDITEFFQKSKRLSPKCQVTHHKTNGPQPSQFIYTLCYSIQAQLWSCNCCMIYKTGIPCSHLIKILKYFKGSIFYYVNPRWLVQRDSNQVCSELWQLANFMNRNGDFQ